MELPAALAQELWLRAQGLFWGLLIPVLLFVEKKIQSAEWVLRRAEQYAEWACGLTLRAVAAVFNLLPFSRFFTTLVSRMLLHVLDFVLWLLRLRHVVFRRVLPLIRLRPAHAREAAAARNRAYEESIRSTLSKQRSNSLPNSQSPHRPVAQPSLQQQPRQQQPSLQQQPRQQQPPRQQQQQQQQQLPQELTMRSQRGFRNETPPPTADRARRTSSSNRLQPYPPELFHDRRVSEGDARSLVPLLSLLQRISTSHEDSGRIAAAPSPLDVTIQRQLTGNPRTPAAPAPAAVSQRAASVVQQQQQQQQQPQYAFTSTTTASIRQLQQQLQQQFQRAQQQEQQVQQQRVQQQAQPPRMGSPPTSARVGGTGGSLRAGSVSSTQSTAKPQLGVNLRVPVTATPPTTARLFGWQSHQRMH